MPILKAEPQTFPADLFSVASQEHGVSHEQAGLGEHSYAEGSFAEGSFTERCGAVDDCADSDASVGRRWWVLQTKPRQEKSLARDLIARGISYYLPQVSQTAISRRRRQTSFIPLFTGYLFMFGNESERYTSMTTNRIANYLPVVDNAQFGRELQQIWQLIDSEAPLTIESRLKEGDRVRVKKGTLAGVEGTVVDRRGRCRLLVAVHLLQQGVSMEIDDYMLEPL